MARDRGGNKRRNHRGGSRGSRGFGGGGRGDGGISGGGGGRGNFKDGDRGAGALNPGGSGADDGSGSNKRGGGGAGRGSGGDRGGGLGNRGGGVDRGGGHGGRPYQAGSQTVFREIQNGLQLCVVFKNVPTSEEMKQKLKVHSMRTRPPGKESSNPSAKILLFRDVEALESAKLKLDVDPNVKSTDYMGMKAAENQANSIENRQIFMKFDVSPDEDTVKKLDGRIKGVKFLTDKTTVKAEFSSMVAAASAVKQLKDKIGTDGLRLVCESLAMKRHAFALSDIQSDKVVLRDVPKEAMLKDIIPSFPDTNNVELFIETFPASNYCHAALRFKDTQRVSEILATKEFTILGKKVFAVQAHRSLLQNHPQLGQDSSDEMKSVPQIVKESVSGPPSRKKIKLDNADYGLEDHESDEEDGDEEDSDDEGSDDEGSDDESSDEEGTEEEEEDGDGAEEE